MPRETTKAENSPGDKHTHSEVLQTCGHPLTLIDTHAKPRVGSHLHSIVEARVRPATHCDVLTHGRGAALDGGIEAAQDGGVLHLVEHTQRHHTCDTA